MGGTVRGLSRRSFVAAGAVGVGALALRPRRTIADVLDVRSPVGLWGVARTDAGLVGLWSSGGRPTVVQLSDHGPVTVRRHLADAPAGVAVAVAAGGAPTLLGAVEGQAPARSSVRLDHLPESARRALAAEVDGPLSVVGLAAEPVGVHLPVGRTLDGSEAPLDIPAIPGGVVAAVLRGVPQWVAVQHPPTPEGDHCSSLTVLADGSTAFEVHDLGVAGPASLVGPSDAPLVSVVDGSGLVRAWRLGAQPVELPAPGAADAIALHVAEGRPVALLASPDGATLLGHGAAGWEVLRDVAGTAGCRRVLAVAGPAAEFVVEVADGVRHVDGRGNLR